MLVLSSPSGAGKTTLSRKLLAADPGVELSVSVTTRKQRPGEVDGRDYHFLDAPRFDAMVENGELLRWKRTSSRHCLVYLKRYSDGVATVMQKMRYTLRMA